jgi:hypothetical protein
MVQLAPQYIEWIQNNPKTAAAATFLSAIHSIGIQQGFEISGYQLLLDFVRTLGVAPLAADAISSIMQGVASVVAALFDEYRRRGEEAIRRARVADLREIIGRALTTPSTLALPFRPIQVPPVLPDPYVPPPPKAAAKRLAIRDIHREPPPTTPQRREREGEMPEAEAPKAKVKASPPEPKAEETGLRPMAQTAVATSSKAASVVKKGVESDTESTRSPQSSLATTAQTEAEAKGFLERYFEHKIEEINNMDIEGLEAFLVNTLNIHNRPGVYESSLRYDLKDFLLDAKLVPKNRYIQYVSALEPELAREYKPQLRDEAESLLRAKLRDEIKDIEQAIINTKKELEPVVETVSDIEKKISEEQENLADARLGSDKRVIKAKIHRLHLDIEKAVKRREMLKSKVVKFEIQKKVQQKKLDELKPAGASSSSAAAAASSSSAAAASSSGAGKYKGRGRPKAKTASRLKPIKEDEEVVELIKPARNHLPYLDLNNDPYLINKLR